jgi:putative acetyltransferase
VEDNGIIIGFGDVNNMGYFDLLYVHKDWQRRGVASLIAADIESYSRRRGFDFISTDASITAKPFFENRGYLVCKKQEVEVRGQTLTNYKMEKKLGK